MNRYMPLVTLVIFGQAIIAYLLIDRFVLQRLYGPIEELEEPVVEIPISNEPERIYRDLGEFLINPADTYDTHGLRFLKTQISLGVAPAAVYDQLDVQKPRLRDVIIRILTAKTVSEMDGPEDREFIKDEIKLELSNLLPLTQGEVLIQVYFTEFIIQ